MKRTLVLWKMVAVEKMSTAGVTRGVFSCSERSPSLGARQFEGGQRKRGKSKGNGIFRHQGVVVERKRKTEYVKKPALLLYFKLNIFQIYIFFIFFFYGGRLGWS